MLVAAFASGFLCLFFLVCLYDRFRRSRRLIVKIPGDTSWPIVGNSIYCLKSPAELFQYFRRLYKKYGPIYQIHVIIGQSVGIVDPKLVENILSSPRYNHKYIPYNFLKPWLNEGLLVSNGKKWYQRRKLLTQAFHFHILKRYTITFIEKTQMFLELLERHVNEEQVNIIPLITSTTIEIMCETAMGTLMQDDMKSVAKQYWKAIEIISLSVFERLRKPIIHSNYIYQLTNNAKTLKKALADVHFFTRRIVEGRRIFLKYNNIRNFGVSKDYEIIKKGNVAMLDLLLQNQEIGNIDETGVKEEVDTFMFEGHDTTAQALIYFIMLISNETVAQNKIYEEMKNIFGDSQRTPTIEDLHNMKYLECCIKESLRLYPSVPIIMRYVKEGTTLGDYVLPSNTHIFIPIFDLHRREDIYPEPESFIPERFLPENITKRHPYAYIPFSAGPRNCIGQKFAMLEIKTFISSLLRRFRLEAVTKPTDLMFRTDIILRTEGNPIYVKFHKRE